MSFASRLPRPLLPALLLPFLLAACANVPEGGGTTTDRALRALQAICASEPPIHAVFISYGVGRVDEKIVALELKAHIAITSVCNSNPTDTASALQAVAKAFADVVAATNHAKAVATSQGVEIR